MTDDRTAARAEAAELLGVDVEHLSPADALRCDMISSLRLVIDAEQAAILSGSQADPGKLNTAVQSLISLLPGRELPAPPPVDEPDPRQVMFDIYMGMRRRGELAGPEYSRDAALKRIAELEAENAALKAAGAAPAPDEPAAAEPSDNVVPLKPAQPAPRQPAVSNYELVPANEPWRAYSHLYE